MIARHVQQSCSAHHTVVTLPMLPVPAAGAARLGRRHEESEAGKETTASRLPWHCRWQTAAASPAECPTGMAVSLQAAPAAAALQGLLHPAACWAWVAAEMMRKTRKHKLTGLHGLAGCVPAGAAGVLPAVCKKQSLVTASALHQGLRWHPPPRPQGLQEQQHSSADDLLAVVCCSLSQHHAWLHCPATGGKAGRLLHLLLSLWAGVQNHGPVVLGQRWASCCCCSCSLLLLALPAAPAPRCEVWLQAQVRSCSCRGPPGCRLLPALAGTAASPAGWARGAAVTWKGQVFLAALQGQLSWAVCLLRGCWCRWVAPGKSPRACCCCC